MAMPADPLESMAGISRNPSPTPTRFLSGRRWTEFELRTVLSLLCKGIHRSTDALGFGTALNNALNAGHHELDIPVDDVRDLLAWVYRRKKAAVAFIDRQITARITRTAVRVFARDLGFDGTLREWVVEGRREREAMKRTAGLSAFADARRGSGRLENTERFRINGIASEEQAEERHDLLENGGKYGALRRLVLKKGDAE